jgi:hypothetical protein
MVGTQVMLFRTDANATRGDVHDVPERLGRLAGTVPAVDDDPVLFHVHASMHPAF